jgi:predicted Ser/Thr protein kinase
LDPSLQKIERYRVIEEVGRGGMAVVYRGRDRSLDREVAIKVLHAHLADAPESKARFQQEARAVAKLHHRNIIEIYDYADADAGDIPSYIVTEFIEGHTLKDFMEEHKAFFPEAAALIGMEICEAIGHAHGLGIIHRDLKPENMMIDQTRRLKLMDFGIAKVIDQQQQMTMTGSILGSPAHMAPEMLKGKDLDKRSDLFSVGTVLYWLATGQLPFTGNNPHQVLRRIMEGEYPDPQQVNPELGADLARIIKRSLATQPEDRYGSADDLKAALQETLTGLDLDSTPQELVRFFEKPSAYLRQLKPKVVTSLLERGRRQLKVKKHRQALEALDRLLAMEAGHPEALALVSGLERRKQWIRRLGILGASLAFLMLAATGTWAALTFWPQDLAKADAGLDAGLAAIGPGLQKEPLLAEEPQLESPDAGSLATADAGPRASQDAGVIATRPDRRQPHFADKRRVATKRSDPPPVLVEHAVEITSEPYFEELLVDGKLIAKAHKNNNYGNKFKGKLSVGSHRLTIRNKTCQELEKTLDVPEMTKSDAVLRFRYRLTFKPALLVIDSEVPDAEVFVNGEYEGIAAEIRRKLISIPVSGKTGKFEVRLRLTHQIAGEMRATIEVRAGQLTQQIVASLQHPSMGRIGHYLGEE